MFVIFVFCFVLSVFVFSCCVYVCVWLSVELGGSDGRQTAAQAARPEVITMYYLFLGVSWIDVHKHTYITISLLIT